MLKKNQVDAHANRCRRCDSVSCVDCSVSFYGDDYRQHTSCISEAERYEKTVYKGNGKNGKKAPQDVWMDLIADSANTAPSSIRHYMTQLATLDNVPRKPKQFRNFTANSLKLRGGGSQSIVDAMWDYLSQEKEKQMAEKKKQDEQQQQKKEEQQQQQQQKDAELSKAQDDKGDKKDEANTEQTTKVLTSKMVSKTIKKVLKKAPKRSMKFKLLRQAVSEKLGTDKSTKKRLKKMMEEFGANNELVKIDGKIVTLC